MTKMVLLAALVLGSLSGTASAAGKLTDQQLDHVTGGCVALGCCGVGAICANNGLSGVVCSDTSCLATSLSVPFLSGPAKPTILLSSFILVLVGTSPNFNATVSGINTF